MSGNKSAHSLNLKRFYDIIKVERKVERKNKTMAKKIVRGITDVKTINNQDFDTNNVNDLLSDGQYNYIHRKKGKNEEYHNLTDNIKTLSSDNTDLLTVTNNNKTTNTATLHPKHDAQKEQVLESQNNTITINHGTNGTAEKTTVDTNPKKVLEHENLLTDYGIDKTTIGNTTKLVLKYTGVADGFDLNNLKRGKVKCSHFVNAPKDNTFYFVSASRDGDNIIQEATELLTPNNDKYVRTRVNSEWGAWRQQVGDKSVIDALLAQKQDKLSSSGGIGVLSNNTLRQLYMSKREYTDNNGFLKTHVTLVSLNTDKEVVEEEYSFILKINKGSQDATFTLTGHDKDKFNNIITAYGVDNTVRINGCLFTLSDHTLTVSTDANTGSNYVITFCDII